MLSDSSVNLRSSYKRQQQREFCEPSFVFFLSQDVMKEAMGYARLLAFCVQGKDCNVPSAVYFVTVPFVSLYCFSLLALRQTVYSERQVLYNFPMLLIFNIISSSCSIIIIITITMN